MTIRISKYRKEGTAKMRQMHTPLPRFKRKREKRKKEIQGPAHVDAINVPGSVLATKMKIIMKRGQVMKRTNVKSSLAVLSAMPDR